MKPSRFLLPLALLAVTGVALAATPQIDATKAWLTAQSSSNFSKMMSAYLGDPFKGFFGPASMVASSAIYTIYVIMAQAIAALGLVLSIQRIAVMEGDAQKQFWRAIYTFGLTTALMTWIYVPGPYSIKNVITASVTGSYVWSVSTFGGQVDAKLGESEDAFLSMLASTATVASVVVLPQAGGAMLASTKALATAAANGGGRVAMAKAGATAAAPGLRQAGASAVGFVMQKLGGTMTVLSTFLTGYGALLEAAGWGVVVLLLGLPIGLALLNFGQTTVLWSMFGTWIGTVTALLIMPLVLVHAIDTAFVQPVAAMNAYSQTLGAHAQKSQQLAEESNRAVQTQINGFLDQCQRARQANPENVDSNPCQEVVNQGMLANFGTWISDSLRGMWNEIELTLASIADSFVSFGVMLFRLGAGLVFAALIMFGVPILAITMFGGVGLRK